jgi:hypothetical protein
MFNPLQSSEMTLGLGRVMRLAAAEGAASDAYARGQLMSGYSVARHLAVEQAQGPDLLEWTRAELALALADHVELPAGSIEAIRAARAPGELGAALSELLVDLRAGGPDAEPALGRVHGVLREMADREVAALAAAPE